MVPAGRGCARSRWPSPCLQTNSRSSGAAGPNFRRIFHQKFFVETRNWGSIWSLGGKTLGFDGALLWGILPPCHAVSRRVEHQLNHQKKQLVPPVWGGGVCMVGLQMVEEASQRKAFGDQS